MNSSSLSCLFTKALASDDVQALAKICSSLEHDLAFVDQDGYRLAELARQLGAYRCLAFLHSEPSKRLFKVLLPSAHLMQKMDAEEFLRIMGVCYCEDLRFITIEQRKEVMAACSKIDDLQRRKKQDVFFDHYSIFWLDSRLGFGLVAQSDCPQGGYIGEYTGMIRQASSLGPCVNDYCVFYPVSKIKRRYILDARLFGNELRFVNHSRQANLKAIWHIDRSLLRLFFVALRKIHRGEQFTIDYGETFWS